MAHVRQEVLIVCLVESSVTLWHEWSDVLMKYMSPLLQRMAAAVRGSRNEVLRIGFVSYSDSYVHPNPILARRFFSPVLQLTKELNEDPASLGIGRTASGGHKGMAILEGYAAVLEMFDAVGETRPPPRPHSNEAQPELVYDSTYYLIHVASSPPDNATKPAWNTNPALDEITWASLPSELLKRKIRPSMILTRPIPELLDLHKHISRTSDPYWMGLLKPSHRLLFSGLPPDKIVPQKRPATESTDNPQQPAQPRPPSQTPVAVDPPAAAQVSVTQPTSVGTSNLSPRHPGSVTVQSSNESPAQSQPQPQPQPQLQLQPQPQSQSQPQPQPQLQPPPPQLNTHTPPQPQSLAQVQPPPQTQPHPQPQPQLGQPRLTTAVGQTVDPQKLINYIRGIENECRQKLLVFNEARKAGTPQAELDAMQAELAQKASTRGKLVAVYQQMMQRLQANAGGNPNQPAAAPNSQPAGSGPTPQVRPSQEQPESHITPPNPGPSGHGGPFNGFSGPNPTNKNPFQNKPISMRSGMEAQMQKLLAERTRPPVLAAAPQTQPQLPLPTQNPMQSTQGNPAMTPNQAANPTLPANPNPSDIMTPVASLGAHVRRWQGVLTWPAPSSGPRQENHIHIALFSQDTSLHCESWPQKLVLQPARCAFNMAQIHGWVKELNPSMALLSSTPIVGNVEATIHNIRMFRQLKDIINSRPVVAFSQFDIAGGPPGTGCVTFPMKLPAQPQGDSLVALVFRMSALPAAIVGPVPPNQAPSIPGTSPEAPSSVSQAMNTGVGPVSLQNLPSETKAYLQQRQAAALAAYNQQQLAQQAHQQGLIKNTGSSSAGQGPGAAFNVAPFLQGMQGMQQQTEGGNQMGIGGLNPQQTPALQHQQVQHRQPPVFNPGQMNSIQMLQQYPMNGQTNEGQGQ